MGVRPNKALSQHFLVDGDIADTIVNSMAIQPGDHVLEIGPGEGVLTDRILHTQAEKLIAVELDRRLALFLKVRYENDARFQLIENDFLKEDLTVLAGGIGKIRVIGNLPYAITSPILFKLLDHREHIKDITVMVQKEVAERLASPPNSKAYGIPSVLFQLLMRVEWICEAPPEAFRPPPKVDSAVIRLCLRETPLAPVDNFEQLRFLVRTAFGQRRKMLRNTLKTLVAGLDAAALPVSLTRRPESLTIEEWAVLSNAIPTAVQSTGEGVPLKESR